MRVISGVYKRRRFDPPRSFRARPTTDFAKESLFNVLAGYLNLEADTRALDLFAGTGSISLELLSRGCGCVVSVEKERDHYAFIRGMKEELQEEHWIPVRGDVFRFVRSGRMHAAFDLVFADPPYDLPELPTLPDLILESTLLKPAGLFILEHGKKHRFDAHPCFLEQRTYGSVHFSFFRHRAAE
ncbi:MAG: RsmD family RNA methyltransferase [Prevotellaceae bacterium]|jgi:16S rRNA (guanine(966)-N(2))-methyltransferase RsmD|nr:RsmD family RNA methyltransferase [Prevotellaceae bacterium]